MNTKKYVSDYVNSKIDLVIEGLDLKQIPNVEYLLIFVYIHLYHKTMICSPQNHIFSHRQLLVQYYDVGFVKVPGL